MDYIHELRKEIGPRKIILNCAGALIIRDGKILGREHYYMKQTEGEETEELLRSFITQYYASSPKIPHELILSAPVNDRELLEEWLKKLRGAKTQRRRKLLWLG